MLRRLSEKYQGPPPQRFSELRRRLRFSAVISSIFAPATTLQRVEDFINFHQKLRNKAMKSSNLATRGTMEEYHQACAESRKFEKSSITERSEALGKTLGPQTRP
jgi:hypothetical protein